MRFGVCHADRTGDDIAAMTRAAAETAQERAGEEREHSVLMLLCDGLTPDQRAIARGAYEVTSALVALVGGAAGDDLHWRETFTLGEERVSGARAGRGLDHVRPAPGRVRRPRLAHVRQAHAHHPRRGRRSSTSSTGSPPLDVILSERGAAPSSTMPARSGRSAWSSPIGIRTGAGGPRPAPDPRRPTPEGGPLAPTRRCPGADRRPLVMASDADALLDGARRAATAAARGASTARPASRLVFSCCTRGPLLARPRSREEVDAISEALGGVPAAGFYTCGSSRA